MPAPAAAIAAKAAARIVAGEALRRVRQQPGPPPPPPKDGRGTLKLLIAIAVAVVLAPALIVVVLFGGAQQNADCAAAGALPGAWTGPGSLGGVAGTGVTRAELDAARAVRGSGGTRLTPGTYSPTAYFPNPHAPPTNCASTCVSTASGIRVNNATRRAYLIASNPRLNQYGALAYIWPNPYGWSGPFVVADTGSAFHGAGRLDFYIFMAAGESWQQALARAYQWGPANQVKLSAAPIRPGGPSIAGPLGLGPGALGPGGAPPPLAPAAPPVDDSGPVLDVGDSLAVGSSGPLEQLLGAQRLTTLAARNRTSTQGLAALRRVATLPSTLVVQLGTNDTSVRVFRRNVRSIVAIARPASARVLWVTIARPPLDGSTDADLNEVLRVEAGRHDNLQLVDWRDTVAAGRVQLADGVHPTAAGYRLRARLIADAIAGPAAAALSACGSPVAPGELGELAGTPEQIVNRAVLYAQGHGFPSVTPASVRAANDRHSPLTSSGNPSDHKGPPDHAWAADISNGGSPTPEMDALAAAIASAFQIPWHGSGLVNHTSGGYRLQLIYRAAEHYDHIHFGVKRLAV
jgi:3D (Asp-Asp-Asp) domain-containing protein